MTIEELILLCLGLAIFALLFLAFVSELAQVAQIYRSRREDKGRKL